MDEGNTSGDYVIMDNDKLVSKNYLTIIHNTNNDRVYYKFYAKLVQSIDSPIVRSNWIFKQINYFLKL